MGPYMKKITLRNSFMKKKLLTLLVSCIPLLVYSADPQVIQKRRFEVSSFEGISNILDSYLGPETAVGLDIDGTLLNNFILLPGNKRLYFLQKSGIYMTDEEQTAYLNAKKELKKNEDEDLFQMALEKGGYVTFHNDLQKKDDTKLSAHEMKIKLKQLPRKYTYTEDKKILKDVVSALQDKHAFVAITTAGGDDEERRSLIGSLGIHRNNWVIGSKKLENLLEIATTNYINKRPVEEIDDKTGLPKEPLYKDTYTTLVLIDDHLPVIDEFLNADKKLQDREALKTIKQIIGVHYKNPLKVTSENIVKEYRSTVGKIQPEQQSDSWGSKWWGY